MPCTNESASGGSPSTVLAGQLYCKWIDGRFNQVDPDHSQEWLNGAGNKGG